MNREEMWEKAQKEGMVHLYERWLDEHEYEDINEYLKVIQTEIPDAYAMSKRPFGFKVHTDDMGDNHVQYRLKGNSVEISMVKVK